MIVHVNHSDLDKMLRCIDATDLCNEDWIAYQNLTAAAVRGRRRAEINSPETVGPRRAILRDFGRDKIETIKALRSATSLGLREAKDAVDRVGLGIPWESTELPEWQSIDAASIVARLRAAGATADVIGAP